jgi:uncharacterized repeat protein (TIGR03803 family)
MRIRPLAAVLFLASATCLAQDFEIVRHFILHAGNPRDRLLPASDGNLYGTARDDGGFARGSIFRFVPDGGGGLTHEELYSFHGPDGYQPRGLVEGPDGRFYGTTTRGGALELGTAFVFDVSGTLVQLHDFTGGSDGAYPGSLILASDGNLYGVTFQGGASNLGTVYRLSPDGALMTLHEFAIGEGALPSARLLQASDGNLYGVTSAGGADGNGTAFRMDPAGNLSTIHEFEYVTEGADPRELIQAPDGSLLGTTCGGGSTLAGTVFRMDSAGTVTVLHVFDFFSEGACSEAGLTASPDGNFYGTTSHGGPGWQGNPDGAGSIYHLAPDLSFHTDYFFTSFPLDLPHSPVAALVLAADGALYGTTSLGGSGEDGNSFGYGGTFFRFDPATGPTFLHDFGSVIGVRNPGASLVEAADGNLYGTSGGGLRCCDNGPGTVYRLRAEPLLVHEFTFDEGEGPNALLASSDGNLYGTSANNGPSGAGTAYRIALDGTLTLLHAFAFADPGFDPAAGLTEAAGGLFYGSTKSVNGTLYSLDGSGNFTTLHAFTGPDGLRPEYGHLALTGNGAVYGVTNNGGSSAVGTVFRLDPAGPSFTVVHDFTGGDDGGSPATNPTLGSDGSMYGTASVGGSDSLGTVFRVDATDQFTTIHAFTVAEGGAPYGPPILAPDGNLYGACTLGPIFGAGTVYRLDTNGSLTTVHEFNRNDGATPQTAMILSADGMLYGTATYGGPTNTGVVYRLDLAGAAPSLAAISPASGRAAGGVAVTVTGDHLREGASVAFSSTSAHASRVLDAFTIFGVSPELEPGTLNDVTATNADGQSATLPGGFFADFLDAPGDSQFHSEIETIFRNGITVGCGGGNYCTDAPASRAQMAVLLLKVEHGPAYTPPPCTGTFPDVVCPSLFADWIEQFAAEEISAGCGGGNYCPGSPVTREQLAVFILKYEHGPAYVPPPCNGVFADVPCPSQFADWIEQFAMEKITVGCGGGNYCPHEPTTRGQMAVFLTKALGL